MERILQEVLLNKDSVYPKLNEYLKQLEEKELLDVLDGIKEKHLYSSYFHGLHHSQKVCLFTYLICKHLSIDEVDTKILMDAALYHDIGRIDDSEDVFHGYNSASKIEEVVDDPIYKDRTNLTYLKAICDAHSAEDSLKKMQNIFRNYAYESSDLDFDRFNKLATILKDADALDRTRFKRTSKAALEERFLRLDYSKKLVEFASLINKHYAFKVSEHDYAKYKDEYENKPLRHGCFHGIGFDFFKLESILDRGILSSYQATKENVDIVRNFNGNNKNIWISAVDTDSIVNDGKAYNNFIKQGISFYFFTSKVNKGSKNSKGNNYNIANNSGEYEDESFVFNKVPVEHIHSIVVFKDNWNKNIDELFYLSGAHNFDIVYDKVMNFIINIKRNSGLEVDYDVAEKLLNDYKKTIVDFEKLTAIEQKKSCDQLFKDVEVLVQKINVEVQKWMLKYYQKVLNTDKTNIKVSDVVGTILKNSKLNIDDIYDNEDEIMIVLNPALIKEDKDKTIK